MYFSQIICGMSTKQVHIKCRSTISLLFEVNETKTCNLSCNWKTLKASALKIFQHWKSFEQAQSGRGNYALDLSGFVSCRNTNDGEREREKENNYVRLLFLTSYIY